MEHLEAWEFQRFLGRPATFGDDRALTNRILTSHRVVYQDSARAETVAPDTLQKFTDKTIVERQALTQQLKKIAENGYAVDLGEHIEDVRSVAVAVRDYTRAVVGALAVAGPSYRLSQERIEKEVVPLMVKAGRDLSARLGFDTE